MNTVLGCAPTRGGLIAVDPGEAGLDTDADLENADLDDFSDLDPDDADLQAALAEEDLVEADIGDAGEVADELVGDVDGPEVPDGPEDPEDSEPEQLSAEADAEAGAPARRAPGSSSCRRTAAARTRRPSSSVTTTTIFRPRRSRWRAPPRTRSRTT